MITHRYQPRFDASASSDGAAARQAWIAPAVIRMEAGAAELGANPNRPEGAFAGGS